MTADANKPQMVPKVAPATLPDQLLKPADAARFCGRATSTFWRDVTRGALPRPLYIGPSAPRWWLSELRAALDVLPREKPAAPAKRRKAA
jgi:predicted DNA-binding transcriptional regulator AlpA